MKGKTEQYLVQEGDKFILYHGHPKSRTSTRVDATMAFVIGLRMGQGDFKAIELLNV